MRINVYKLASRFLDLVRRARHSAGLHVLILEIKVFNKALFRINAEQTCSATFNSNAGKRDFDFINSKISFNGRPILSLLIFGTIKTAQDFSCTFFLNY
jgi:hypothetical protein